MNGNLAIRAGLVYPKSRNMYISKGFALEEESNTDHSDCAVS